MTTMNEYRKDMILLATTRALPANPVVTPEVLRDESIELSASDLISYGTWLLRLPSSEAGKQYNRLTSLGRAFWRDAVLEGTDTETAYRDAKHSYGLR